LTAQFAHLGSTVFDKPELDIPEQQLALAYTIDYDLDNFAAAVGFARQSVYSLTQEPGKLSPRWGVELMIEIEVEVGDSSLEEGVYEPVQRILDQVRTVKVSSRYVISSGVVLMNSKLVAQMEEVWQISSALLPEVTVALADLSTSVSSAVDLAVQVSWSSLTTTELTTSWRNVSVLMQLLSAHPRIHFDYPISRDS
jgi:dynactin 1